MGAGAVARDTKVQQDQQQKLVEHGSIKSNYSTKVEQ